MFPSVILTFLLEVRLVSGAVHQLGDLVSGRQVHPAHWIVRLCQRGPYWFLRNAVCLSLLEKPAFILSILVDQCRAILNNKILLRHSPWHWTVHLVRMRHPQHSWKITLSLILIAAQKHTANPLKSHLACSFHRLQSTTLLKMQNLNKFMIPFKGI